MDWTDRGIVLSARKHGENAVILSLLTETHGRHMGLVRGGTSRKARGMYEPGNVLDAHWRARLEDHLGSFACELADAHAAHLLDDPLRLAGLSSLCAIIESALPEREAHATLYHDTLSLIEHLNDSRWLEAYVQFEVALLRELGFGLDLSTCAATGRNDQLIYVSPRSGCAVSASAGEPYRDKLLPLPAFLANDGLMAGAQEGDVPVAQILDGLRMTGYFLDRSVFIHSHVIGHSGTPPARERFIERLRRQSAA
jgi:DNA repair protein RecO (recombination protein O)